MRVSSLPKNKQKQFKEYLNPRWQRVFDIGLLTGLRISDIVKIRIDELSRSAIGVVAKKTGKLAEFPVPPEMMAALQAQGGQFWLFPSPINPVYPVTRQAALKAFKRASELCGLQHIGTHSLRKTFAQNMLASGASLQAIQKALQHDKLETTLLYLI